MYTLSLLLIRVTIIPSRFKTKAPSSDCSAFEIILREFEALSILGKANQMLLSGNSTIAA